MASSSNNATSQLTSSTNRQSRIADAVQVAPYLTHVVRHHGTETRFYFSFRYALTIKSGQVTLIPPENSGRIRKAKKRRPALRDENSSSSLDLLRSPASRSRTHTPRPDSSNSVQSPRYEADVRAGDGVLNGRGNESRDGEHDSFSERRKSRLIAEFRRNDHSELPSPDIRRSNACNSISYGIHHIFIS